MSHTLTQVIVQQPYNNYEDSHNDYLRRGLLKTSVDHFQNERNQSQIHRNRKNLYCVSVLACIIFFVFILIFIIRARIQGV